MIKWQESVIDPLKSVYKQLKIRVDVTGFDRDGQELI